MRRTNINAVLKMVRMYLEGEMDRIELTLDFPYELEKRFDKMRLEDQDYAELIYDRLLDDGIDIGDDLSDEDFYKLIEKQYYDVLDIAGGGFA
ncbi:MAG: hypothetical protein AAGU14_07045 [Eubacteriaceae bacterium]